MTQFPSEHDILSSNNGTVILTSHRVSMNEKEFGRSYNITIFLEDLSSVEAKYHANVSLMIIACIAAIFFIFTLVGARTDINNSVQIISAILAIIFFLAYWFSRQHIVSISSNGGRSLNFRINGSYDEQVEHFIDKVLLAKAQRTSDLYQHLMSQTQNPPPL